MLRFDIRFESPVYQIAPDPRRAKELAIDLASIAANAEYAGMGDLVAKARERIDALGKAVKAGGLDLAIAIENAGLIVSYGWREIGHDTAYRELEPDARAGRSFTAHKRSGNNAMRRSDAMREHLAIRRAVDTERERLSDEYRKAGRSAHGAGVDAIREVARYLKMPETKVKKRYYSKKYRTPTR